MTRRPLDLSVYLVLDPVLSAQTGLMETLRAAIAGGVTVVQWRAPGMDDETFARLALDIRRACDAHGLPLIVDDRVEVAKAIGAAGVHVGQRDMPVRQAREMLGENAVVGLSVSNLREFEESDIASADYLGVGPVYPTSSKPDAAPTMGLEALREIVRRSPLPAVAIGGITAANAAEVFETGVDGVAVISAICGQPDPKASARSLASVAERFLKPV